MYISSCTSLLAAVLLGLSVATSADSPPLPSSDSFYNQPANISQYKPGDVIASREVSHNLNAILGPQVTVQVNSSHQYLYRTTDSIGRPVAAVMTILVPNNADPTKLLAYQTAYDSANNDCSPSYALRAGANTTLVSDITFMAAALNNGWYVTTADYEGLDAQFVAGVQAGQATLDSVRAALASAPKLGLSPSARYALWGYSGGSLASEWAAELQPTYAPELDFAGAALGGTIANVTDVLLTINQGPFTGLAFAGTLGMAKAYPNLTAYINKHMLPNKTADFKKSAGGCFTQDLSAGAGKDLYTYFDRGHAVLSDDVPSSILATAGIAGVHGVPKMPLFIYKANGDEVSPGPDSDLLVQKLCSKGAVIEYHRDAVGEHLTEAITGSVSAFAWVADRLAGKPVTNTGCVTKDVALTSLDLSYVPLLGLEIVALLQTLLIGGNLGRPSS